MITIELNDTCVEDVRMMLELRKHWGVSDEALQDMYDAKQEQKRKQMQDLSDAQDGFMRRYFEQQERFYR